MSILLLQSVGIPVSPYSVRRAIENTCNPIGDCLEDKLSSGQGLMQVDKLNSLHHIFCFLNCIFNFLNMLKSFQPFMIWDIFVWIGCQGL